MKTPGQRCFHIVSCDSVCACVSVSSEKLLLQKPNRADSSCEGTSVLCCRNQDNMLWVNWFCQPALWITFQQTKLGWRWKHSSHSRAGKQADSTRWQLTPLSGAAAMDPVSWHFWWLAHDNCVGTCPWLCRGGRLTHAIRWITIV